MTKPIAICIEKETIVESSEASDDARYTQCVALAKDEPGLGLTEQGEIRWKSESAYQLLVSSDGRLALYRSSEAQPAMLRRAGRALEVPAEEETILLDQDELELGPAAKIRIHIHGESPEVVPPKILENLSGPKVPSPITPITPTPPSIAVPIEPKEIEVRIEPPAAPIGTRVVERPVVKILLALILLAAMGYGAYFLWF